MKSVSKGRKTPKRKPAPIPPPETVTKPAKPFDFRVKVGDDGNIIEEHMIETIATIMEGLKNHFPPNHPTRFKVELLAAPKLENGDHVRLETPEENREIIDLWNKMDSVEREKALNGWHPASLEIDWEDEAIGFQWRTAPAMRVLPSRITEAPYSDFTVMQDDSTCELFLRVGITKAEAMEALKDLVYAVDMHWDNLIKGSKGGEQ